MFDLQTGVMGSNDKTPADSFQGGMADLEAAFMESEERVIDELQKPQDNQNQEQQLMMMLMQMFGGGM